jgi:competence protein ComEC
MAWSWQGRVWAPAAVAVTAGAGVGLHGGLPTATTVVLASTCVLMGTWGVRRRLRGPLLLAAWIALGLVAAVRAEQAVTPGPLPPLDLPRPGLEAPLQLLEVASEPEWSPVGHRFTAQWTARCLPEPERRRLACEARSGLVRVDVVGRDVRVQLGDRLRVRAFTTPPPAFRNPGAWDARESWTCAGLVAGVRVRRVGEISFEDRPLTEPFGWARNPLGGVLHVIGRWRRHLSDALTTTVPGRAGQTFAALALGDKGAVDEPLQVWLRATGTAHVMAVSGSHLALVVWMVRELLKFLATRFARGLFRRFPRERLLAVPSLMATWGYALLTGAAPSTLRAAVMATALVLGRASGRQPGLGESLGLAAVVLMLVDPVAVADVGLLLSILGVLGLAWAGWGQDQPEDGGWRTRLKHHTVVFLKTCVAPSASTAPATLTVFGALPLVGPLANGFAVPYAGFLLPVALAAMVLSALGSWLGPVRAWIAPACEAALWPLEKLVASPKAWWPVWSASGTLALVAGLTVPAVVAAWWHGGRWRAVAAVALVATAATWAGSAWLQGVPQGTVRLSFLDVGHGDCTLVELPDGSNLLVDGGGEVADDGRIGAQAVVPFLKHHGIRRIDRMVLTHGHPDHENGLLAVARVLPVGELWWNGQVPGGAEHQALVAELTRQGTRWRDFAGPGSQRTFSWGGVQVRVLWPFPMDAPYSAAHDFNDNSLVLEVSTAGGRVLLAGDIEAPAEAALAKARVLRPVDVLKVPHHGSRTSSTPPLLEGVRPGLAVVGARPWGQLPFPHREVSDRYARYGIPLWPTTEGWVEVVVGRKGVTAQQEGRSWSSQPRPPR